VQLLAKGIHLTDEKGVIGFELLEDLFRWANGEPRLKEIFFDVKLRTNDAARAPLIVAAIRKLRTRDDLACTLLLPQRELYAALAPWSCRPTCASSPTSSCPTSSRGCARSMRAG